MPKTRFDQYTKQPVDKVKALILERKVALGLTQAAMARIVGVSPSTMSYWLDAPSANWPFGKLMKFMHATGVPFEDFAAAAKYKN